MCIIREKNNNIYIFPFYLFLCVLYLTTNYTAFDNKINCTICFPYGDIAYVYWPKELSRGYCPGVGVQGDCAKGICTWDIVKWR